MADREVEYLLVGAGVASAYCASELRKRGAEGVDPARRPRAGAAVRPAAALEGLPARRIGSRRCAGPSPRLVRAERHRADHLQERHGARRRGADRQDPGWGGGRLRQGPAGDRGDGEPAPRRRRPARGDPLPAGLRQLRFDPRRRRRRRARRLRGRQLYRRRGGRLARRDGKALHDRRDRARDHVARLRRRGRAVRPRAAGLEAGSRSSPARRLPRSRATSGWPRS